MTAAADLELIPAVDLKGGKCVRLQEGVAEYARLTPGVCELWPAFAGRHSYLAGGYDDPETYRRLADRLAQLDAEAGTCSNRLFYLATPPVLYPVISPGDIPVTRGFPVDPRPGERILDLCAAPGAKATHLAALAHGGARVTAVELHASRAAALERLAARWTHRIVCVADAMVRQALAAGVGRPPDGVERRQG